MAADSTIERLRAFVARELSRAAEFSLSASVDTVDEWGDFDRAAVDGGSSLADQIYASAQGYAVEQDCRVQFALQTKDKSGAVSRTLRFRVGPAAELLPDHGPTAQLVQILVKLNDRQQATIDKLQSLLLSGPEKAVKFYEQLVTQHESNTAKLQSHIRECHALLSQRAMDDEDARDEALEEAQTQELTQEVVDIARKIIDVATEPSAPKDGEA